MKNKIIIGIIVVVIVIGGIIFGVIQNKGNLGQETSSVQEVKKENMIYPHYDSEKKATGYIDIKGNYVIEPQFSIAHMFDKDMTFAIVNASSRYESGNKVGVIDKDGNYIIEPKYSSISLQSNKYFILDEFIGNKHYYGLADISGNMLINIDTNVTDEIKNISEDGIMFVNKNNGNGYFNLQGEKVISVYRGERFENGYAIAQKEYDGQWGIINEKGEWVVEPFAEEMSSLNKNGYAGYSNENDEWGIVNINGNKSDAIFYGRIRFCR